MFKTVYRIYKGYGLRTMDDQRVKPLVKEHDLRFALIDNVELDRENHVLIASFDTKEECLQELALYTNDVVFNTAYHYAESEIYYYLEEELDEYDCVIDCQGIDDTNYAEFKYPHIYKAVQGVWVEKNLIGDINDIMVYLNKDIDMASGDITICNQETGKPIAIRKWHDGELNYDDYRPIELNWIIETDNGYYEPWRMI